VNIQDFPRISTPTTPLAEGVTHTGRCLEAMLRGQSPQQRADIGTRFVVGKFRLIWPTPAQVARLVCTSPVLIHRALGHPVRPPCPADMASYISRYGIERTEALIAQIRAVVVRG
jgi:hypothetical protein